MTDLEGGKEAPYGRIYVVVSQDSRCDVWDPGHVERGGLMGIRVGKVRWYKVRLWLGGGKIEGAFSFGKLFAESVGSSMSLQEHSVYVLAQLGVLSLAVVVELA